MSGSILPTGFFSGFPIRYFRKRNLRTDQRPCGNIGVIPAILFHGAADLLLLAADVADLGCVRDTFGCLYGDFCFLPSGQQHIGGRLGRCRCAASCGKSVPHVFYLTVTIS